MLTIELRTISILWRYIPISPWHVSPWRPFLSTTLPYTTQMLKCRSLTKVNEHRNTKPPTKTLCASITKRTQIHHMVCSTIRNVDLMRSLFLSEHLYSSSVWQGLLLRNIHQKDMCQDEIEVYVLRLIINTIEKICVITFWFVFFIKKNFTLTFYNFYTSTMVILKLLQTIRVWFTFADTMEQFPIESDCENCVWRWKCRRTFMYHFGPSSLCCITHQSNTPEITD